MGAVLLAGGAKGKRFALPHSRVLLHQPLMAGLQGQASDIDIHAKDIVRMRERLNQILSNHTGQPIEKIHEDSDRDFILEAFRLGAGTVLIGACHLPYDCHYINGNYKMKARTDALKGMLTKLGMSPERFRVEYVSAAEGIHYAEVITEIDADMKALGKEKIKAENAKLRPIIDKILKRKKK